MIGARGAARRRLARIARPATARRRPQPATLGAFAAAAAVSVIVGGWLGIVLALPAAVVSHRLLRRLELPEARERRDREAADLPIAADLLAATLKAGAPVDRAAAAVADALQGPLGKRLATVARTLRLGAEPDEAWRHLDHRALPGGQRLARAAVRSSASGAALAGTLIRLADDLRADRAAAVEARARRAGVLIVLPLGLCFLPAFILAGLVPVIVAVLGDVL
jgi:Flp pilus assembly protein TadB